MSDVQKNITEGKRFVASVIWNHVLSDTTRLMTAILDRAFRGLMFYMLDGDETVRDDAAANQIKKEAIAGALAGSFWLKKRSEMIEFCAMLLRAAKEDGLAELLEEHS